MIGHAGSPVKLRALDALMHPLMSLHLDGVHLAGLPTELPVDRPLLLCPNHVSWWDGFLAVAIHRRLRPGRRFVAVMLQEELDRRRWLRSVGAVGLDPGSISGVRPALRALDRARRESADLTVAFFPQGRIWPSHRRPLGFQEGVRVVARVLDPVTVLPLAIHLAPGTEPGLRAWISAGEPLAPGDPDTLARRLETRVEEELDRIRAFLAEFGEGAPEAWSRHFIPRREASSS